MVVLAVQQEIRRSVPRQFGDVVVKYRRRFRGVGGGDRGGDDGPDAAQGGQTATAAVGESVEEGSVAVVDVGEAGDRAGEQAAVVTGQQPLEVRGAQQGRVSCDLVYGQTGEEERPLRGADRHAGVGNQLRLGGRECTGEPLPDVTAHRRGLLGNGDRVVGGGTQGV